MSEVFEIKTTEEGYIERVPGSIKSHILGFKPGTYLNVRISKPRKAASNPFRKYYFVHVCNPIADHIGENATELHENFKRMFAPVPETAPDGHVEWLFGMKKEPDKNGFIFVPRVFARSSPLGDEERLKFIEIVEHFAATKLNFTACGFYNSQYGQKLSRL